MSPSRQAPGRDRAGRGSAGHSGDVRGPSALGRLEREEKRSAALASERASAHLGLRISVIGVLVVGLFSVLAIRLWSIQVIKSSTFRSGALQTFTEKIPIEPPRGEIVATRGQVLAGDIPEEVVTIRPAIGPNGKSWVALDPAGEANVSALLDLPESKINADLNSVQNVPHQPVPIAFGVSEATVLQIDEHASLYPGISVVHEYVRSYPQDSLAAQILGYVGQINASEYKSVEKLGTYSQTDTSYGQTGLEAEYERVLYGKQGYVTEEVDPAGNPVATLSTTPPVPGDTVVLNMDLGLERTLATDLEQHLSALRSGTWIGGAFPAPSGAGVVIDVHTGAVLAMVSLPSYNNNLWVGGISEAAYSKLESTLGYPLNDYAVQSPNPPGSDFKIATATAALDDGLITPSYVFYDTGTYTVGTLTLHDAPGTPLGPLTVVPALSESSDDFFYNLGAMFWTQQSHFGLTPIQNMAKLYGFGAPSGIDLPASEVDNGQVDSPQLRTVLHGLAPSVYPNTYYEADNMEMAFGQGLTQITPLELANAYATFANGGTRYAPELAAAIVSPSGKLVERIAPKVVARVPYASSADYQAMLQGFQGAVENPIGTAYQDFTNFPFSKWEVAGKTGTATVNHQQAPTAWFVAFFGPVGNPEYAAAVEVPQGGYGTNGAAPVVRQIIDYLMVHSPPPLKVP